ncbi:MAG: glycine oxidase ThiO [Solirubrobacteraceae bacterium]
MPAKGAITSTAAPDVAVIGGGVIGLSVAWSAARRGMSVTVFDRGSLGDGASRVAAGMLAPVSEADVGEPALLRAGLASAALWPSFAGALELGDAYRRCGTLVVARGGDEAEALDRECRLREELELPVTRLRGSEARRLEPGLAPGIRAALHVPDDHAVDPRALIEALVLACEQAGVTLRPNEEVSEPPPAGRVVLATGAWAGAPVRPVKGQILRLRDPDGQGLLDRVIRGAHTPGRRGSGFYVVPRGDGRYVLGATVEERGFDTTVTAGGVRELLQEAQLLIPGLDELVIEDAAAGLRPGTPDNGPLLGERADGVILATGHHRNGILLAPLTGQAIAALLAGEPMPDEAAAFAPARFAEVAAR